MTVDIQKLRDLMDGFGGKPPTLYAGHIADPNNSCNCTTIMSEDYLGGIARVHVHNGISSIAAGRNDCPPVGEAALWMTYLVEAANAIPELLAILDEKESNSG